ncbi:unnamed protein product [Rotaria socialis]|uniref:Uncharacterized protein n=1 Tax=Rotaria socialis TaxID=392032 RepID=A0A818QKT9_9BILA|nr:unnamed protein product [Rotaria socialis]CAF3403019.1 unnamed protein product [Rotaria socialis]CAF3422666.1 unnamed protein product [Rotaria socialis]CAF3636231.1 unnamed protein product [Rotaria socialis]CAF3658093.1 unnamed protein product [Rotaria socialis]
MADINEYSNQTAKRTVSFSNLSQREAEIILGFKLRDFYDSQTQIEQFITTAAPEQLKNKIFGRLIDCIGSEGFPVATICPMNQSVVKANIGIILQAMVAYSQRTMNHDDLMLKREIEIISKDEQFGGNMEFAVTQMNDIEATRYVLVVETIGDSLGRGLTQMLLTLKSMWDVNNDQKMVHGFLTTAINWQLVTYDGQTWKLSEPSTLLLANMRKQEDRWLKNNTQILDAIYSILASI